MKIEKQKLDIEKIVDAGQKVYLGYLLLDMINDEKNNYFTINNKKGLSFSEYITELIKEGNASELHRKIQIGEKHCKIQIRKGSDNKYNIKITDNAASDGEDSGYDSDDNQKTHIQNIEFKPENKYSFKNFLNLCSEYELTLSCNNEGKYAFSTKIDNHEIGGPDKIDLYPIHISNLYQMINHVKDDEKNPDVLIAMATGSGKSFTQALWTFVLDLAGYHGVCAVHQDALVSQLKEDFHRLLPDTIADKVTLCDQDTTNRIDPNSHIITTHDLLFKEKSSEFEDLFAKNNKWWISVDEAHNAAKVELYKKSIENLQNPIAFLTATPSEVIAEQVRSTINLSLKEKEEQGISKAPTIKTKVAESRIQKVKKKSEFKFGERMALWFASVIEKERLSSAHECIGNIEECVIYRETTDPFHVPSVKDSNENDIRKSLRWNVHLPIGEKFLGLVGRGSHDPVVNFHLMLNSDEVDSAYESGNKVSRKNVYNFFGLSALSSHGAKLDEAYLDKYKKSKKELKKAGLRNYLINHRGCDSNQAENFIESNVDYLNDAAKYQEFHVLHGIIENTISYLTGYDSITLDHKRRHDLDSLVDEVKTKLSSQTIEEHKNQILINLVSEGMPDSIAKNIAEQEKAILKVLERNKSKDKFLKMIVDNWVLDKKIHDLYRLSLSPELQRFCKEHKTIFLVNGLQKTATKVKDNKPFFNLEEKSFKLSEDGNDEAKSLTKHKLSTIEALDDTTLQYYYEPNYCGAEYTEKVVDKLFKKGFVGSYITSEKTTGFNDINLCNVGLITDKTDDNINDPAEIIQAFGRNRGLNWAKQPTFSFVTKQEVKASFDVNKLTKNGYVKALNKANKKHHKELVKRLGSKIAKQIQDYIDINTEPSGEINSDYLGNKLIDIIWNEYESLYNQNNHDNDKTKNDFINALNDTYKILYSYKDDIKKNYQLPISAHVITFILEFITKIIYWFQSHSSYKEFKREAKELENNEKKGEFTNERTYAHIIQNYKYKDIVSSGLALKKVLSLAKDKAKSSKDFMVANLHKFVKTENAEELQKLDQLIKDLLNELIATTSLSEEQKKQISCYINEKESWIKEVCDRKATFERVLRGPFLSNNSNNNINEIIFNLVSSDPTIKQYLEKEKITEEKFDVNPSKDLSIIEDFIKLQSSNLIKELMNNYENVVDKDKAEKYAANSIAHYFQSKTYQKLLNYFISPLKEEHLLAILNSIYPQDNVSSEESNAKKLEKILKFKQSIVDERDFVQVVKKCEGIEEIFKIQKYIPEICFEILHCRCYYQNMSEKGDLYRASNDDFLNKKYNPATPKLYSETNNQENLIWNYSSRGPDLDAGIMCNKIQFISGSIQSFDDVGKIDFLDNQKKIEHGQEAADNLLLFNRALKNHRNNTSGANNRKVEKIASKLRDLAPLTSKNYYNAVQQEKESYYNK